MAAEDLVQLELMLNRFKRLVGELQLGVIRRTNFEPWELEILVDLETCQVNRRRWVDTLRKYQRAVERQMEGGSSPPMKLSEYLSRRAQKRSGTV